MKKTLITLLILLILSSFSFAGRNDKRHTAKNSSITKTYDLKYIKPALVHSTLNSYFSKSDFSRNGKMITLVFRKNQISQIPQFEKLLKKLDIKKQTVIFRIFTVIASHKSNSENTPPIKGDLKKVLSELQTIMSFKSFRMDGMSALTAMDGQKSGSIQLSSEGDMKYTFYNLKINGSEKGSRDVDFEFNLKQYTGSFENKQMWKTLQNSKTSIKEGGYLVAGVSKIGRNGDSLILVINTYIK